MNKSVEDLVEKVRQYAGDDDDDHVTETKPRRPLTGYYTTPQNVDITGRVRPLRTNNPDLRKEVLIDRNSFASEGPPEKTTSLEDLSGSEERSKRQHKELTKVKLDTIESSPGYFWNQRHELNAIIVYLEKMVNQFLELCW